MGKKLYSIILLMLIFCVLPAQEALKSMEEEYYDFLSLTGVTERPTLGYRTLSDSVWVFNDVTSKDVTNVSENGDGYFSETLVPGDESDAHLWKNNNLGSKYTLWTPSESAKNLFVNGLRQGFFLRIYGPEWFNSYNTAAPYGQNDGGLWQGRGYNTALTAGVRLEGYGFELTFKPQLSWSQNREFKLVDNRTYYSNKYAYIWGYGRNIGADAPQRFGDSPFWSYDWGDSEIRWSWYGLTLGFGTQPIWLGPAWLNPVLHSNNAAAYPKFDIGIRKTAVIIPYLNWYLGDIEARMWLGRLSESDFFDEDDSNNHNQITGLSVYFSPSFLPGLILGLNKICLSKWDDSEFYKYLNPFYGMKGAAYGNQVEDQKVSITAEWLAPKGGIDLYAEFGIDDHINYDDTIDSYVTHYWHTFVYTFGFKKEIPVYTPKNIYGEFFFEWNNTEMSQDFQMQWNYSFGFHSQISQGYTNRGQWLGSGIGYGGQSQYVGFKLYYPKGASTLYLHRYNPDNNFLFKEAIYDVATGQYGDLHARTWNYYKGILAIGIQTNYFVTNALSLGGEFAYVRIVNPLYNQAKSEYEVWHNVHIVFSAKFSF